MNAKLTFCLRCSRAARQQSETFCSSGVRTNCSVHRVVTVQTSARENRLGWRRGLWFLCLVFCATNTIVDHCWAATGTEVGLLRDRCAQPTPDRRSEVFDSPEHQIPIQELNHSLIKLISRLFSFTILEIQFAFRKWSSALRDDLSNTCVGLLNFS